MLLILTFLVLIQTVFKRLSKLNTRHDLEKEIGRSAQLQLISSNKFITLRKLTMHLMNVTKAVFIAICSKHCIICVNPWRNGMCTLHKHLHVSSNVIIFAMSLYLQFNL